MKAAVLRCKIGCFALESGLIGILSNAERWRIWIWNLQNRKIEFMELGN